MPTKAAQKRAQEKLLDNYQMPTSMVAIGDVTICDVAIMTQVTNVIAKHNRGEISYHETSRLLEELDGHHLPVLKEQQYRLALIPFGDWYMDGRAPTTLCHYRILIVQ